MMNNNQVQLTSPQNKLRRHISRTSFPKADKPCFHFHTMLWRRVGEEFLKNGENK